MIEDFNLVIDLPYDEFLRELDDDATTGERYDLLLLARSAMEGSFDAIKLSFDRIEGLRETPIEFDIPKFYVRFPNATHVEGGEQPKQLEAAKDAPKQEDEYDATTARLRATLKKMRTMPKQIPDAIMVAKRHVEEGKYNGEHMPQVKQIICANLILISRKKPKVVSFVFDQIYGKLAHKIRLMDLPPGEDIYVNNPALVAPSGSFKGEDGVFIWEDLRMKAAFLSGFARLGGKYAGLRDGDDELQA